VSAVKRRLEASIEKEVGQKKAKFSTPDWFQKKMFEMNIGECIKKTFMTQVKNMLIDGDYYKT
jgi:hypothetical protein